MDAMKRAITFLLFCFCNSLVLAQPETWSDAERLGDVEHWAEINAEREALLQSSISIYDLGLDFWSGLDGLSIQDAIAIKAFIDSLGELKTIYELIYVPGLDEQKLFPHEELLKSLNLEKPTSEWILSDALRYGRHEWVMRSELDIGREIPGLRNADSTSGRSPMKLYSRYRYQYPGRISWGLVLETDAGEALFAKKRLPVFSFAAGHIAIQNLGCLKDLVLGDYRLMWGAGLLSWTGFGMGRGVPVHRIAPHGTVLKPYTASNEFNFYRGAAARLAWGKLGLIGFSSYRQLDASIDSIGSGTGIRTIYDDGLHRTESEKSRRRTFNYFQGGLALQFTHRRFSIGLLNSYQRFSLPILPGRELYQQKNWYGRELVSSSLFIKLQSRKGTFFSEAVLQNSGAYAFTAGYTWHPAPSLHLALSIRSSNPQFFSLFSNGPFSDSRGRNESGIYAAMHWSPFPKWSLQAYADIYRAHWLGYREDRPAFGTEYLMQLEWKPERDVLIYLRWKRRVKSINLPVGNAAIPISGIESRMQLRLNASYQIGTQTGGQSRLEWSWSDGRGFYLSQDIYFKHVSFPLALTFRVAFFKVSSFNSRIYAYEHTPLYQFGLPAFNGIGNRTYLMLKYTFSRNFQAWLKLARSGSSGGSLLENSPSANRWEIDIQGRLKF